MEAVGLITTVGVVIGLWFATVKGREAREKGEKFDAGQAAKNVATGVAAGWWLLLWGLVIFLVVFGLLNL